MVTGKPMACRPLCTYTLYIAFSVCLVSKNAIDAFIKNAIFTISMSAGTALGLPAYICAVHVCIERYP
jgi:hypothetical protein